MLGLIVTMKESALILFAGDVDLMRNTLVGLPQLLSKTSDEKDLLRIRYKYSEVVKDINKTLQNSLTH